MRFINDATSHNLFNIQPFTLFVISVEHENKVILSSPPTQMTLLLSPIPHPPPSLCVKKSDTNTTDFDPRTQIRHQTRVHAPIRPSLSLATKHTIV